MFCPMGASSSTRRHNPLSGNRIQESGRKSSVNPSGFLAFPPDSDSNGRHAC
jgi:hypothetical protein